MGEKTAIIKSSIHQGGLNMDRRPTWHIEIDRQFMQNQNKKRMMLDLIFEVVRQTGGPLLVERFKAEVLPHLKLRPGMDKVISEEEYQHGVASIKKELPYFLHYLTTLDLPEPPATWTASQN
jgi:hypothetical protein